MGSQGVFGMHELIHQLRSSLFSGDFIELSELQALVSCVNASSGTYLIWPMTNGASFDSVSCV